MDSDPCHTVKNDCSKTAGFTSFGIQVNDNDHRNRAMHFVHDAYGKNYIITLVPE